ncbi:DNA topoisomerase 3 [Enterocloster clostridioformis]|uniref:DNA topoisomerase 3 n=1 Tax=Enterocloster clostridioformis TaxID=1531 RepID=UPI00321AC3D8
MSRYGLLLTYLVLAEKPSVAQSLAKVLGANKRCDGYLEGNGYIVSWCVGHLVELSPPEAYDETYAKWRLSDLPILPATWKYQVSASTRKQFGILKKLMKRDDVESLVCATDAGREGELIFRLVYHQAGCRKPFERLWISSMEDQVIKDGFAHLEPSTKYDALYEAALCRERADWIVGMNATRLFSCLYHQTLNIGRVMTPTLAMVVMRDAEIAAFKPKPFYTVQLGLNGITAASRRINEKADAQQLLAKCKETMKAVIKSMDRKEKTERAPLLYDLTSLQRDANRILGFTAQQTLDYTQALYEKKLVTYPRTDSRYLTDDMKPMLPTHISQVAEKIGVDASALKSDDNTEITVDVMCDSRKVSDHHAIIPTKTMCSANLTELPSGEKAILQLIAVRLLCAAAPDYRYAENTIVLTCGGEEFSKKIKTVLFGGWKDIWQRFYPVKDKEKEAYTGPTLSPDTIVSLSQAEIKEGKTTAPKRFTEDTLLSAMETAGAEDIPEDAERKGLGTPATRAGTIEKLVQKGFMERKGDKKTRYLASTDKGNSLITVMPEQIQSASMTADWEQKLLRMEHGDYEAQDFMREITDMISGLVQNYEAVKGAETLMSDHKRVGTCPCCQADVLEKQKGWFCSNKECRFVLWKDNAFFKSIGKHLSSGMVEKLLSDGRIRLKDCKSQKSGKNYNATLLLSTEENGRANFHLEFENSRSGTKGGGEK